MAEGTGESLAAKFGVIFPHLDERQRRLLMGAEARVLGHGGIRVVARAAGAREATVSLGARELEAGAEPLGRARRRGGGRKRLADLDPGAAPGVAGAGGARRARGSDVAVAVDGQIAARPFGRAHPAGPPRRR
jgi:hypothetical protein